MKQFIFCADTVKLIKQCVRTKIMQPISQAVSTKFFLDLQQLLVNLEVGSYRYGNDNLNEVK